jgi:hypothetical protein
MRLLGFVLLDLASHNGLPQIPNRDNPAPAYVVNLNHLDDFQLEAGFVLWVIFAQESSSIAA